MIFLLKYLAEEIKRLIQSDEKGNRVGADDIDVIKMSTHPAPLNLLREVVQVER